MLKKILIALGIVLIIIQFFRPDKNDSNDLTYDISTKYDVPNDVNHLLQVSCNDCHSNKTEYPWYSNVQPVAWWLDHHVDDGKKHLNFSEFTKRPLFVQNHKFDEIIEMVEEKEMPTSAEEKKTPSSHTPALQSRPTLPFLTPRHPFASSDSEPCPPTYVAARWRLLEW